MRLTTVLSCVNNNPEYYNFIPYQIKIWKYFHINFLVVFVGDSLPEELLPYKDNIFLWNYTEDLPSVFVAQNLRLYIPAILTDLSDDELVMITDMDMLPGRIDKYTRNLENYKKEDFITYRDIPWCDRQVYMCYNAGHPKIWSKIFNINKEITYWFLPNEDNRSFPIEGNIVTPHSINGGYTYTTENDIYIYRYEDFCKVMIHELLHHSIIESNTTWTDDQINNLTNNKFLEIYKNNNNNNNNKYRYILYIKKDKFNFIINNIDNDEFKLLSKVLYNYTSYNILNKKYKPSIPLFNKIDSKNYIKYLLNNDNYTKSSHLQSIFNRAKTYIKNIINNKLLYNNTNIIIDIINNNDDEELNKYYNNYYFNLEKGFSQALKIVLPFAVKMQELCKLPLDLKMISMHLFNIYRGIPEKYKLIRDKYQDKYDENHCREQSLKSIHYVLTSNDEDQLLKDANIEYSELLINMIYGI